MGQMRYTYIIPLEDHNGDPYTLEELETVMRLLDLRFGRITMKGLPVRNEERMNYALWRQFGDIEYQNITEFSVIHGADNPEAINVVGAMIATILRCTSIDIVFGPEVDRAYARDIDINVARTIGYINDSTPSNN